MLVRISEASRALGVTPQTLRRWDRAGKIKAAEHSLGGHRLYEMSDLYGLASRRPASAVDARVTVGYARVSTSGQHADLVRQEAMLQSYCVAVGWSCEIINDTGSGLNYSKRGLRTLIRRICNREVNRLVLTDRDRLLRFGAEIIFSLCEQFGVEVVIINSSERTTYEEDLASDVLEILTVFAARMYGARSRRNKALITRLNQAVPEPSDG